MGQQLTRINHAADILLDTDNWSNQPAYVDPLTVPIAYSVPCALIAIATLLTTGSRVTAPLALFFGVWFFLIQAAAFLLTSTWARLRFAPARWAVHLVGHAFSFGGNVLFPALSRLSAFEGTEVDDSIQWEPSGCRKVQAEPDGYESTMARAGGAVRARARRLLHRTADLAGCAAAVRGSGVRALAEPLATLET